MTLGKVQGNGSAFKSDTSAIKFFRSKLITQTFRFNVNDLWRYSAERTQTNFLSCWSSCCTTCGSLYSFTSLLFTAASSASRSSIIAYSYAFCTHRDGPDAAGVLNDEKVWAQTGISGLELLWRFTEMDRQTVLLSFLLLVLHTLTCGLLLSFSLQFHVG